jgi:hypothetical protein
MKTLAVITASIAFALSATANAQFVPDQGTREDVTISFKGFVTNDVTDTIMIRQPDGNFTKYTGPVPDYPYKVGDEVSISFRTSLPNRAYYEQDRYANQRSADGIYRFNVVGNSGTPGTPGTFAYTNREDFSGPANIVGSRSEPYFLRGLTVVYDANTDAYSLELPTGSWSLGPLTLPSYIYNPETGLLSSAGRSCVGPQCEPDDILSGDATSARVGASRNGTIPISSTQAPERIGYFDGLNISGGFNLPFFRGGSSGNPTEVPEPATVLLFGAGAAALMRRRRKKA